MDRRAFFAALVPVSAAATVASAVSPEQAHTLAGGPVCPRCHLMAMYTGPYVTPEPGKGYPVECCECGWVGVHVRVRSAR